MDAVTEDRVLGGRIRLRQPARGYRAGLDAALLAAACDAPPGARVLEAGAGPGPPCWPRRRVGRRSPSRAWSATPTPWPLGSRTCR